MCVYQCELSNFPRFTRKLFTQDGTALQGTVHVFKLATAEAKAAAARQLAAPGSDGNANPVSSLKFVSVSHHILSVLLSLHPAACMVHLSDTYSCTV